jgi:hypothetical protein
MLMPIACRLKDRFAARQQVKAGNGMVRLKNPGNRQGIQE